MIKDQNANGAPKKTLLERMKTKAWLSFIFESKNTREINAIKERVTPINSSKSSIIISPVIFLLYFNFI